MSNVQRILHPTDFSEHSAAAAEYASLLTRQVEADVHLLYVVEDAMGKIPEAGQAFPSLGDRVGVEPRVWPRLEDNVGVRFVDANRVFLAALGHFVSSQSKGLDYGLHLVGGGTGRLPLMASPEFISAERPATLDPVISGRGGKRRKGN